MKLGYKIAFGFTLGMVMVVAMGLYTVSQLKPTEAAVVRIEQESEALLKLSTNTLNKYQDAIYYIRAFLATRKQGDYDQFLERFQASKGYLKQTQELLANKPHLVDVKELVDKISSIFITYEAALQEAYDLSMALNSDSGDGSNSMEEVLNQYKKTVYSLRQVAIETGNKTAVSVLSSLSERLVEIYYVRGNIVNALWENNTELLKQESVKFNALAQDFKRFSGTITLPNASAVAKKISASLDGYAVVISRVVEILEKSASRLAYRRQIADNLSAALTQLNDLSFQLIDKKIDSVKSYVRQIIFATYAITGIVLLISVISAFIITRGITVPVNRTNRFARRIAEGNLEEHLDITSKDEIGELTKSLNTMVDSLKAKVYEAQKQTEAAKRKEEEARVATVRAEEALKKAETAKRDGMVAAANQLEEIADVISSAATELSAQVEESERGAVNQATRVSETATAMDEMSSTVIEVAKNASETSDISAQTRQKAIEGAEVVKKVIESIEKVHTQSRELKADMSVLGEHAQSINQIMGVISDIADQTNLLALNAAIEAARAGEAGRGFAVVADEVRKLAEKTMVSTTDVGNAIKAIQESARQSMTQVDSAVSDIEVATELASESGLALDEIVTMAESTADQIRTIATASEEQSASTEEINLSISEINNIARETSQAMDEANKAVSELARQAQMLTSLINDMKES